MVQFHPVARSPGPNAEIKLSSASDLDGLGLALFPADGGGQLIEEDKIDIGGGNETAETAYLIENIADVAAVTGLSIYTAEDIDWFKFTMKDNGTASDTFELEKTRGDGIITIQLFAADGPPRYIK